MEEEFVRLRLNTKSTYLNFNNNIYNLISIRDSSYFVEIGYIKTLIINLDEHIHVFETEWSKDFL